MKASTGVSVAVIAHTELELVMRYTVKPSRDAKWMMLSARQVRTA
jgi:hypothetical protein